MYPRYFGVSLRIVGGELHAQAIFVTAALDSFSLASLVSFQNALHQKEDSVAREVSSPILLPSTLSARRSAPCRSSIRLYNCSHLHFSKVQ